MDAAARHNMALGAEGVSLFGHITPGKDYRVILRDWL